MLYCICAVSVLSQLCRRESEGMEVQKLFPFILEPAAAADWDSGDWCPSAWLLSNPSPDEYYSDADVYILMGGDLFISGKRHTIQFWPLS